MKITFTFVISIIITFLVLKTTGILLYIGCFFMGFFVAMGVRNLLDNLE